MKSPEPDTIPLTKEETVRRSAAFPVEHIIERYSHDYDVPPDLARRHAEEIKRFLVLCALHPEKRYGMRGDLDRFWHTFMIYSREYTAFCEQIAGRYIHHAPEGPASVSPEEAKSSLRSYQLTLTDYEREFAEPPPSDIWPRGAFGNDGSEKFMDACGSSCRSCGNGCSSCGHGCTGCTRCGS